MKRHTKRTEPDPQRDRVDRPAPSLDAVEGDEQTIEEDLRIQEERKQTGRTQGGGGGA